MATHMMHPYHHQVHQQEQEHRRRAAWAGLAVRGPWAAPPATCHSQGANTWSKRVSGTSSNLDTDSWEVRAFAEDASSSGQWPPRSYSCSFCQREFRTAQALGGHMNVHRRERAHANQLAQLRNATASLPHSQQPSAPAKETVSYVSSADFAWLPSSPAPSSMSPPQATSSISLADSAEKMSDLPPATRDPLSRQISLNSQISFSGSGAVSFGGIQASTLSTSPPSQESISSNSTTMSTAILDRGQFNFENLSERMPQTTPPAGAFHGYEDYPDHLSRSLCFSEAKRQQDETLDLELRLGQGPCTV